MQRVRLTWQSGGREQHADCAEFPFEFTVPVADADTAFRGEVTVWTPGQRQARATLAVPLTAK